MKVLIVNSVPTGREGISTVIFNLLENIKDPEIQFGYVSMNIPSYEFKEKLKNVNCQWYVVSRRIKNLLSYTRNLYKIASNFDAIHIHGNSATLAIDLLVARIAGIKYRIAHSHNTSCKMVMTDKLLRPLFYKLCNGRVACGKEAGNWLFGKRSFTVIQNGISTNKYKFNIDKRINIRESLEWSDQFVLGHVGNFVEAKNHKFIIDFFNRIIKVKKDVKLICVGDGRLFEKIKSYASSLGLTNLIHFTGSVSNPEDYMSAMDAVIMPSTYEGFPLSLVEEQANGLPCLVADTITKEVNLTGNLTFLPLTAPLEDWCNQLLHILSKKTDDRTNISNHCISLIKDKGFDISTEAKKMCKFYKSLP